MTHKERMLMAVRGEMPDVLPYAPRFDLWYNANSYTDTLPPRHRGRTADEIARAEGWALQKVIPQLLKVRDPEDIIYRGIGLYSLRECGYRIRLSPDVQVQIHSSHNRGDDKSDDVTCVEYHTHLGKISVTEVVTEEMRKAGASITWIKERAIKRVEDYAVLASIFQNIEVIPDYDRYAKWQAEIGGDGIASMMGTLAASPMQHIQRDFLEATDFFIEYEDHQKEMQMLAESVGHVCDQILRTVVKSTAEVVLWGANYDDMITYPPYFEKEITPWLRKASAALAASGKALISHCDGENHGLLQLIRDSGINIAEAVCPAPMTKVSIDEYYKAWGDKLTIFGGIPQSLLLEETASEQDFNDYLDHFFKAIAPGTRIIVGIADTTPPNAVFDRLVRLGERIEKEGRLPLAKSEAAHQATVQAPSAEAAPVTVGSEAFQRVMNDVLEGDREGITSHVREMLAQGISAQDILQKGMIAAMEIIGQQFKTGDVFIPEVLLAARAMNEALRVLDPYLSTGDRAMRGKVVIGTVRGDLHDIGKNMVATMLRGAGLEIRDIGANVSPDAFVKAVNEYHPDIVALSALLTTTMPEMREVIGALDAAGLRQQVKVVVGGAPVNAKYASSIGADGYAADAGDAVQLVKGLLATR